MLMTHKVDIQGYSECSQMIAYYKLF